MINLAPLAAAATVIWLWDQFLRDDPAADVAKLLKSREVSDALNAQRSAALVERQSQEDAQNETEMLQSFARETQGLKEGWLSPMEAGARAGGPAGNKLLIKAMAARLNMRPDDLEAAFDPHRANIWLPDNERGSLRSRLGSMPQKPKAHAPMQMGLAGFGSEE